MQDRAAPDPGGMASHSRIGSGFVSDAPARRRVPRDRGNYLTRGVLTRGLPDLSGTLPCVRTAGPVQWVGQQAVLALPERMQAANAGQIGEELLSVINGGATALIADMTATIWCDHVGADAVVRAFRRAVVSGIELRLVVPAEHVSRVLSLSGLDHLVPSYPSLEGATAASPPAAARMARARLASVSAEAVAMARRVGDRGVLAHAPYTQCFATWGPDTLAERATLGREPVDLAEDLRAPGLILAGLALAGGQRPGDRRRRCRRSEHPGPRMARREARPAAVPVLVGGPPKHPGADARPLRRGRTAVPAGAGVGAATGLSRRRVRRQRRCPASRPARRTGPAAVIRAVAIPRLDPGAVGIHLAWSGPELTPLAIGGYEVRRRDHLELKTTTVCATFDTARLAQVAETGVLPDELGLMLMHTWRPAATHIVGPLAENVPFTVFTQELTAPADQVSVSCTARAAVAIAISAGKTTAVEIVPAAAVTLSGQAIDTVAVYALEPTALRICVMQPAEPDKDAASWAAAEVVASGLTLPLRETDPSLVDPAHELAKARQRLLSNETFTPDEAENLAAALRRGAADQTGRPCDRVLLDRTDTTSPYQESTFSTRIGLVTLDPRLRRVLGFGHADTTAVPGQSYDYRVSGRFVAADLADEVYDVHQIASGTALPTTFHTGDVNLRLGAPTEVVLDPAADPDGLTATSRRGIALTPGDPAEGFVSWWSPDLSCVIDLPRPVERLVLEISAAHGLSYSGSVGSGPAGPFGIVPPGPSAVLTFASPVDQVRLVGAGTLYALRLPAPVDGVVELSQVCGPVQLAPIALPAPPVTVAAVGLQTPPTILTGPIGEQTPVAARPQPGFRVLWEPAIVGTSTGWPDDLDADPPIDALAFIVEHRRVYDASTADPWEPIQAGDNLTFGSWPASQGAPNMGNGVDLDVAFPLHRQRAAWTPVVMSVSDVLSDVATTDDPPRAAAPLGSSHQYRIQTMDVVGRVSATWTELPVVRLEKHIPPPLPVGPQPEPELVGHPPRLSAPLGVRSRTILASDPDLSAADSALLGSHQSAVVLEWGWRPSERELDPTTQEFRVYAQSRVPTVVPGVITSITAGTGQWVLGFTTDRDLVADECAGQWLTTADQAFRIETHTAGSTPQLTVAASLVSPATAPLTGSTVFGRPLTAAHQRPALGLAGGRGPAHRRRQLQLCAVRPALG